MKNILIKLRKFKKTTIFITSILLLIRIFLGYAEKSKGLYLVHDYMYSIINYLILASALLIYLENKKIRWTYLVILLILTVTNTVAIYKSIDNIQFQSSFNRGENSFIVKETKDEAEYSLVYTTKYGIFIRLADKIKVTNGYKPFSNLQYEVTWINDEKALIKILNGSNHVAKGKFLNFTKLNGQYLNVLANLEGTWTDKSNSGNTISFDRGQITYKSGNKIYWYSSSMADEQGNYGSILYGANNTPSIYLLVNGDNTITMGYVELKNNKQNVYSR